MSLLCTVDGIDIHVVPIRRLAASRRVLKSVIISACQLARKSQPYIKNCTGWGTFAIVDNFAVYMVLASNETYVLTVQKCNGPNLYVSSGYHIYSDLKLGISSFFPVRDANIPVSTLPNKGIAANIFTGQGDNQISPIEAYNCILDPNIEGIELTAYNPVLATISHACAIPVEFSAVIATDTSVCLERTRRPRRRVSGERSSACSLRQCSVPTGTNGADWNTVNACSVAVGAAAGGAGGAAVNCAGASKTRFFNIEIRINAFSIDGGVSELHVEGVNVAAAATAARSAKVHENVRVVRELTALPTPSRFSMCPALQPVPCRTPIGVFVQVQGTGEYYV